MGLILKIATMINEKTPSIYDKLDNEQLLEIKQLLRSNAKYVKAAMKRNEMKHNLTSQRFENQPMMARSTFF